MTTPLDDDEIALWHAFKRAGEAVRAAVAEDITRATGLSDPDFGILTRLLDAGGCQRQNELATSLGWHRSRLSHQLTRMAGRGLVTRAGVGGGVEVAVTEAGSDLAEAARPVHAAAVRAHLLDRLPDDERAHLAALLTALAERS
ncbi:MarR family winged helix-turn-helix transcriptional regulator [Actinomycetospora chiangmaiensis]|uniref:MarR family winged helix-turn-helix transcriptional regulator n=1 Tax=Actinomycetospora chiangmaiensis TaxID=402650 RepID=UPI0003733C90|nr:MarR family winged helix-turn-helix transcriptional regulator [Actinomycetospora chiangmaiensis]